METIILKAHTEDSVQIDALKAFMKALKIKFEISSEKEYDQQFVNMVMEAETEIKKGNCVRIETDTFDDLWK